MKPSTAIAIRLWLVALLSQCVSVSGQPNSVGYMNVTIPSGYSLLGVQLDPAPGMDRVASVASVFRDPPPETELIRFENQEWVSNRYWACCGWDDPEGEVRLGYGFIVSNPEPQSWKHTFVGEVHFGRIPLWIPEGRSIIGGQIPVELALTPLFGFPAVNGMKASTVARDGTIQPIASYELGQWTPVVPKIGVGGAVILDSPAGVLWLLDFWPPGAGPEEKYRLIEIKPTAVALTPGSELRLEAIGTGVDGFDLDWYRDGRLVAENAGATFRVPSLAAGEFGLYHVAARKGGEVVASRPVLITNATLGTVSLQVLASGPNLQLASKSAALGLHVLEASTDLIQWDPAGGGHTDDQGRVEYPEQLRAGAQRFYRARTLSVR